jgi:hypothetical protein
MFRFFMASVITVTAIIPQQYQYNRTVKLHTMTQDEITRQCGDPGSTKDGVRLYVMACADINGKDVYMPNPCLAPEVKDINSYAHLLCHEIAHTEGWVHKEQ